MTAMFLTLAFALVLALVVTRKRRKDKPTESAFDRAPAPRDASTKPRTPQRPL